MCVLWATMDVLMCTASIWHMSTMSMDRYFTLKYPMRYGRNKTRKMVAVKITFVWVISIAICCPVCIMGFLDYSHVYNHGMCVPTIREFIIYGSIFAFYVPLAIMVFTYILTIKILCDNQKLMQSIVRDHSNKARMRKERNGNCSTTYLTPNMYTPRFMERPSVDTSISCATSINDISFPSNNDERTTGTNDERTTGTIAESASIKLSHSESVKSVYSVANPLSTGPQFVCAVESPSPCLSARTSQQPSPQPWQAPIESDRVSNASYTSLPSPTQPWLAPGGDPECKSHSSHTDTPSPAQDWLVPLECDQRSNNSFNSTVSQQPWLVPLESDQTSSASYNSTSPAHAASATSSSPSVHTWQAQDGTRSNMSPSLEDRLSHIDQEMEEYLQVSEHCDDSEDELDNDSIPDDNALSDELEETQSLMKEPSSAHQSQHSLHSHVTNTVARPKSLLVPPVTVTSPQPTSSDEGMEDSDSDHSDLITIHLKATGCYMYKLDPAKSGLLGPSTVSSNCATPSACYQQAEARNEDQDEDKEMAKSLSNDTYSQKYDNNTHKFDYRRGWHSLRKSFRRNRYMSKSNGVVTNVIPKRTASNEKKASKVLGIIFAVFVVLWTPFFIMNILAVACTPCLQAITPAMMAGIVWMGYLSSLANPIIYTMFNTAFRRAFYKILTCSYKKSIMATSTPDTMYLTATNQWATSDRRNTVTLTLRDT